MANREWLKMAARTAEALGETLLASMAGKAIGALDAAEHRIQRAKAVVQAIPGATAHVRSEPSAAADERRAEPISVPRAEVRRVAQAVAEGLASADRPRASGKRTAAQPSAKRASAPKAGFKAKRGQKHSHHR